MYLPWKNGESRNYLSKMTFFYRENRYFAVTDMAELLSGFD